MAKTFSKKMDRFSPMGESLIREASEEMCLTKKALPKVRAFLLI
jgi:hypothetical protein